MSIHKLDTLVYVGQKAFINKHGKVLVLKDPNYAVNGNVGLDFPGGKYRFGKNIFDELRREVTEETGLKIKIGRPFVTWTNYKHKEADKSSRANVYCVGYLSEYVSGTIRLSDEHTDFEWVDEKSYIKWKEDTQYFEALKEYFRLIEGT